MIHEKLKILNKHGILYGDISGSNILVSKNDICFCDLDNVAYKQFPMDNMRYSLKEFIQAYGKMDDKAVAYCFNIFTLATLSDTELLEIREINDWIAQVK